MKNVTLVDFIVETPKAIKVLRLATMSKVSCPFDRDHSQSALQLIIVQERKLPKR